MTDSLLKEVDNALRWQRVQEIWARSGKQILLGASLAVISLIALLLYKQQKETEMQAQSDLLLQHITSPQGAKEAGELTGIFAQIEKLAAAKESRQNGQTDASEAALKEAQSQPGGDALLSSYACLVQQLAFASESAHCTDSSTAFSALLQEPRLLQTLKEQGADAAYAMLAPTEAEPAMASNEPARITMLRAYLRSRSSAEATPTTTGKPADELPANSPNAP